MSDTLGREVGSEGRVPLLRFVALPGAFPLGGCFGAVGLIASVAIRLLHLDRLPYVFCTFKLLTRLPCPTCGSTRTFGRLAALDLSGAFAMNPLATLAVLVLVVWALWDAALLPSRRALRAELHPALVVPARILVLIAFLLNWVYLMVAGR
jgi:hypothetical protein